MEAEYADRVQRVRKAMAQHAFGALVVTDPANLFYLTGYNAWSFYTPQCLLVGAEGPPHLFARAQDAAGAAHTCNLDDDHIHGYPEELVHRPGVHPFDWVAASIRDLVPDGELVGVECDAHFFSPRAYFALERGLPANRLVDSEELVNWVRVVKSPHEVAQLRIAGTIVEHAMRTACESVRPGRRQCDVVAEIMAAQATGTPEHGGDYPAIVPMLPTGEAAGAPHLTWTDRPFEKGAATTIELAGAFGRYHAPLARTVMLGEPPTAAHRNREGDRRGDGRNTGRDPPRRRGGRGAQGVRPDHPRARHGKGVAPRATRSASGIRPTGVSARSACVRVRRPSWRQAWRCTSSPGCGGTASATKCPSRWWSPTRAWSA